MTIFEQIVNVLENKKGEIISCTYIRSEIKSRFGTDSSSIIPSDFCYNRINDGINFRKENRILKYIKRNTYEFLGEKFPYTGQIYHKPSGSKQEVVVGEWLNGEMKIYSDKFKIIMLNNKDYQKEHFLTNEFLMFSINAGLQTRNPSSPVYKKDIQENLKEQLRNDIRNYLLNYLDSFNDSNENEHNKKVENMSEFLSNKYRDILLNGRFRIGVSQKLINLFLKYMWTYGKIKMPFHCPFDGIIKSKLLLKSNNLILQDWTTLDSMEEYLKFVIITKEISKNLGLSIAEWELQNWNNK